MQELINFKDQNLSLDYLTLNIPNSVSRISEFAEIFFRYGFNSKVFYVATNESQTILEDKKLLHTLTFRLESDSWNKETVFIQFSGDNSRYLYFLITNRSFSISQLNCQNIKIGRIDIQYIRPNKTNDSDVDEFLERSLQVSKDGIPKRDENDNIQTLAIGKRENAYYIRIYKMDSALKFELEIKKRPAQHLGLLLLNGSYQEFEDYISKSFVKHFWKSIFLKTCFTDWLNYFLRAHFNKPKKHLVTSYLQEYFLSQATSENIQFYRLLQFISFVRTYSGKKEIVNGQNYTTVQFRLLDFMKTVNCQANSYQRQQFLQFFNQLQSLPPFREKFADRKFRQLLFFPVVNAIQETKRGPWIIQISVAEHLMKDAYPFHLPPSFFTYSNTMNLDVKLSIIKALAQEHSIQKIYDVQSFLNQFVKRRHSIQANIKRDIIYEFQNLIKFKIIESRFLFQGKDNQPIIEKDLIEIEDLISSKYIIFYEIINPI